MMPSRARIAAATGVSFIVASVLLIDARAARGIRNRSARHRSRARAARPVQRAGRGNDAGTRGPARTSAARLQDRVDVIHPSALAGVRVQVPPREGSRDGVCLEGHREGEIRVPRGAGGPSPEGAELREAGRRLLVRHADRAVYRYSRLVLGERRRARSDDHADDRGLLYGGERTAAEVRSGEAQGGRRARAARAADAAGFTEPSPPRR